MNELEEIAQKFKTSEPVFIGNVSDEGSEVRFIVKNEYRPTVDGETDSLTALVASYYSERFSFRAGIFEKSNNLEAAYRRIVCSVREVYEDHSPLKDPTKSKMYKFISAMTDRYNDPLQPGFIALYRYVMTNGEVVRNRIRFDGGNNNPHVKNILIILEIMRGKHEN